jgi:TonB family protein
MGRLSRNRCTVVVFLLLAQILPVHVPAALGAHHPAQAGDATAKKPYNTGLELRSDPEGTDFAPYLQQIFLSIRRKIAGSMPDSVKPGASGNVTVPFRIDKDGKIIQDSVRVVFSNGQKDVDEACLAVIRRIGPFDRLPESYRDPHIELRQTFNFDPPKNQQ